LSGKRRKKKRTARGRHTLHTEGAKAHNSGTPIGGLHFTIGTGPLFDPNLGQLTLENDVRFLKAGLLYADQVRLVSVSSSLTLRMLAVAGSDPDRQLDFLERHFRKNISRDDPEGAGTMLELIRIYRPLRRGRNLTKEQIAQRLKIARELGNIWGRFRASSEEFAHKAGADEILAARRSGLVDIDGFAAGGG